MPVSICTQKEVLIDSKLNGFWGVLLLLLDLACRDFGGLLTGVCTRFSFLFFLGHEVHRFVNSASIL